MRLQDGAYRIERVGRDSGPRRGARAIYVQDDVEQVEGRQAQLAPELGRDCASCYLLTFARPPAATEAWL